MQMRALGYKRENLDYENKKKSELQNYINE